MFIDFKKLKEKSQNQLFDIFLSKQLVTIILLLIVFAVDISFATSNENISSKKYYKIINPTNGVQRILNEDGKTILKTETGYPDSEYSEERQEYIGILTDEVSNKDYFYIKRHDDTYNLYDENSKLVLENVKDVYTNQGKITYVIGGKSYIFGSDTSTEIKNEDFIKTVGINESNNSTEKIAVIENKEIGPGTTLDKNENDSRTVQDLEKIKEKIEQNAEKTEDNEVFSLMRKENGKFTFISKKYNYFLDDIVSIEEYKGVFNQKVKKFFCKKSLKDIENKTTSWADYVSDDGRLLIEAYDVDMRYYHNLNFIDNKYIFLTNNKKGYIYEYADTPVYFNSLSKNTDYNVDFVLYGKKISSEFDMPNYGNIRFLIKDGEPYLLIFRGNDRAKKNKDKDKNKNIVIDFKGRDCSSGFLVGQNHYIYLDGNKSNLYTYNGTLAVEGVKRNLIYDLAEIPCTYEKLKKSCYVLKGDTYILVDENGKILLDNIINIYPYIASGVDYTNCDPFLTVNANGYIGLYDENVNLIMKDLDKFEVWRSGGYYLAKKGRHWGIFNKTGNLVYPTVLGENPSFNITDAGLAFKEGADGFCRIYNDSYGYYSNNEWVGQRKPLTSSIYIKFNDVNGYLLYFENGKYNLMNSDGKILLKDYKYLAKCDENWYLYQKGFKYGLIDINGNRKCEFSIFDSSSDD